VRVKLGQVRMSKIAKKKNIRPTYYNRTLAKVSLKKIKEV
jgi:hypothetical protein